MLDDCENDSDKAKYLQSILISRSTGGSADNRDYEILRREFLDNMNTKSLIPNFIKDYRDLEQFWQFIKYKFDNYADRRTFIWGEFNKLLDFLESKAPPSDLTITDGIKRFDEGTVHSTWQKALERRTSDPEGAITSARSLLESVCKHILDVRKKEYNPKKIKLNELYKLTAKELNLSPSQHTEDIFKSILGGCMTVVNGLGSIRNHLGDAHGKGKIPAKPSSRHAELAVNLAGAVALFLITTFESSQK